jgi:hypothetical protein
VSTSKFEAEVAEWKRYSADHAKRGILLLAAEYPKAFAAFALPIVRPTQLLFGVELDFTNYDVWPPSVKFADPLTRESWPPGVSSPAKAIIGNIVMDLFLRFRQDPTNGNRFIPENPVLCQGPGGPAFLCMKGVREYHDHPAHSGDSWLQYRGSGIGTLFYILDKLHEFGISHLTGMHLTFNYISGGPQQVVGAMPNPGQNSK